MGVEKYPCQIEGLDGGTKFCLTHCSCSDDSRVGKTFCKNCGKPVSLVQQRVERLRRKESDSGTPMGVMGNDSALEAIIEAANYNNRMASLTLSMLEVRGLRGKAKELERMAGLFLQMAVKINRLVDP